jgi:hypothetical protein
MTGYTYFPHEGQFVIVGGGVVPSVRIRAGQPHGRGFAWIPNERVPEVATGIATGMFTSAGLAAPLIVPRPWPGVPLAFDPFGDPVSVSRDPGAPGELPGVRLEVLGRSVRLVGDEAVRVAAALLDATTAQQRAQAIAPRRDWDAA